MNWFKGLYTVEAVKSLYRKLAKQYHPDLGGDLETMKQVNLAYHAKLESLNGATSKDSEGKEHTYTYNQETEQELMDKISELLKLPGLEIALIGTWLWITGETKPVKDQLKALGCNWHAKRVCWYWRKWTGYRTRYNSKGGLDDLAAKYGYKGFSSKDKDKAIA